MKGMLRDFQLRGRKISRFASRQARSAWQRSSTISTGYSRVEVGCVQACLVYSYDMLLVSDWAIRMTTRKSVL